MTKETSTPDSLETRVAEAPAGTTVFSDGSTFDYENGYQSNGAPVATRDRTENPKIVKSHKAITASRVFGLFAGLLILGIVAGVVLIGISLRHREDNIDALRAGINNSGQVKVVQLLEQGAIVSRPDGGVFKCDVTVTSKDTVPTALVFCSPGGPATFSIPLPYDPTNPFYESPTKDH